MTGLPLSNHVFIIYERIKNCFYDLSPEWNLHFLLLNNLILSYKLPACLLLLWARQTSSPFHKHNHSQTRRCGNMGDNRWDEWNRTHLWSRNAPHQQSVGCQTGFHSCSLGGCSWSWACAVNWAYTASLHQFPEKRQRTRHQLYTINSSRRSIG